MLFRLIMFLPKSRRPSLQWGLLNVCGKPAMPSSPMSFESSTKVWSLLLWILRADNNFAAPSSPIWLPSRFKHCKQLGFLIAAAKHLQPLHWIWLWLKSSSRRPQFGLLRLLERLSTPLSPMRLELKFRMMILHSKEVRASAIFSAPAFVMLLPARPKRVIWLCKQFNTFKQWMTPSSCILQWFNSRLFNLQFVSMKQGNSASNPTDSTVFPLRSSSSKFFNVWNIEMKEWTPLIPMLFQARLSALCLNDAKHITPSSPISFQDRFNLVILPFSFWRTFDRCSTPWLQISLQLRFNSSKQVFDSSANDNFDTPSLVM